jgi:hypothetical protein
MSLDLTPGINHGELQEVVEAAGTGLVGDHALGVETINVAAGGFRDAGQLRINGDLYDYVRSETGDTLDIAPPLEAAADDGTPVEGLAYPGGPVETQKVAVVDLDLTGEEDGTDYPRATIPGELAGYYDIGTGQAGAMIDVEETPYGYRVVGRPDDAPTFDGGTITPGSIPEEASGPTAPPASSPTLAATGAADAITLIAEGIVEPSTVLDYYMDGSLIASTRSTVYVVRNEPDLDPLDPDITYSFHVIATNTAGEAAPSAPVAAALNPAVSSEQVLAIVSAGFVLAGEIQVGNIRITPGSGTPGSPGYDPGGIIIPLASGGVIQFPADGSLAVIEAILRTTDLNVSGGLTVNGITNYLNGVLNLAAGVADPTDPATLDFTNRHVIETLDPTYDGTGARGFAWNGSGRWATIATLPTGLRKLLTVIDRTTGAEVWTVHSDDAELNMMSVASYNNEWFVLGLRWNSAASRNEYRLHRYNSAGAYVDGWWLLNTAGNRIAFSLSVSDGAIGYRASTHQMVFARTQTNGLIRFYRYNMSGGDLADNVADHETLSTDTFTTNLTGGFWIGSSSDLTAGEWYVLTGWQEYGGETLANAVYNPGGDFHDGNSWDNLPCAGVLWYATDSKWLGANRVGSAVQLHDYTANTADATIYAQIGWYASTTAAESAPSPVTSRIIPKRLWPTIVLPTPPYAGSGTGAADRVRLYIDTDATTKLHDTVAGPFPKTYTPLVFSGAGAGPPASTTFPASSALGEIASSTADAGGPHTQIKGDGFVRMMKFMQRGRLNSGTLVANTNKDIAVTFAVPFDVTPEVVVSPIDSGGSPFVLGCYARNVTTTGFDLRFIRDGTAAFDATWSAGPPTQ